MESLEQFAVHPGVVHPHSPPRQLLRGHGQHYAGSGHEQVRFYVTVPFVHDLHFTLKEKSHLCRVFLFWELHGLSPNFHIQVSVSDLYIPRICPKMSLQQNRQTDPGNKAVSQPTNR